MLALLLSLFGGIMAAAGGGGSKSSAQPAATPANDPAPVAPLADPVAPTVGDDPVVDDFAGHGDKVTSLKDEKTSHDDVTDGGLTDHGGDTPSVGGGMAGHDDTPVDDTPVGGGMTDHGGGMSGGDTAGHDDGMSDHGGGMSGHGDDAAGHDGGMTDHGDHDSHDDHDSGLPTTKAEINAFVASVRNGTEVHVHGTDSNKLGEHTAMLDLVDPQEATHIAIGNGSWFDASNWHNGEVPGDDAKVVIPDSVTMTYDAESSARLFTVRVDGELEFATDVDSKMVVDTFVVSPTGTLTIGTENNPVDPDVNVDIIIANNGAIDTDWDPSLLSRGLISHGKAEIHGAAKDSHDKVIEDPMKGDTSVSFDGTPAGWQVGDTIVVAGTRYEGFRKDFSTKEMVQHTSEDEIRVITKIEDGTVHFDKPLEFDHDAPRADLHTSVANYTRNVSVETENGAEAEVFERGHVMFMHSDDVDVRYAEFHELGRTDKSEDAHDASDFPNISFDDNVKGRYGLHLHRLGTENEDDPAIVVGNSVYGSPGWGFVHHDSHAILDNNASFNTFGAGFVSESGNETGAWTDNIAIYAQGKSWDTPKVAIDDDQLIEFDTGNSGDGFWFQSRMVESSNNIAASVNNGFVYFHRGPVGEGGQLTIDSNSIDHSEAYYFDLTINPDEAPIRVFHNNEAFAAKQGLHVLKGDPDQGHDIHSVFDGFTAWNVVSGADFRYTAHYKIENFDIIGRDETHLDDQYPSFGIKLANEVADFVIADSSVDGFKDGLVLNKKFLGPDTGNLSLHDYFIINTDILNSDNDIDNYIPRYDTILNGNINEKAPTLEIDGPLEIFAGQGLELRGTKTDTLGEIEFPASTDNHDLKFQDVLRVMHHNGYYETYGGEKYFTMDVYFSDRYTADLYKQTELVKINGDVNFEKPNYKDVPFNGKATVAELKALANGKAVLVDAADDYTDVSAEFAIDETAHQHTTTAQQQSEEIWDALTKDQGMVQDTAAHDEHEEQPAPELAIL